MTSKFVDKRNSLLERSETKSQNEVDKHLVDNRGLDVAREIQWTDGCSSQYKSRTPLMDIAYTGSDFDVESV